MMSKDTPLLRERLLEALYGSTDPKFTSGIERKLIASFVRFYDQNLTKVLNEHVPVKPKKLNQKAIGRMKLRKYDLVRVREELIYARLSEELQHSNEAHKVVMELSKGTSQMEVIEFLLVERVKMMEAYKKLLIK